MNRYLAAVSAVLVSAGLTAAPPSIGQVESPVVATDGSVTFRTIAPNASRVVLKGIEGLPAAEMTRLQDGVWEVTVGPLAPELYSYVFEIDGADEVDRFNRRLKKWFWLESLVEVQGDPPLRHEVQLVPHGIVHHHIYPSEVAGREQGVFVYTPPGYDPTRETPYPLVVLLHGFGDDESAWVDVGRAPTIADNMLAEGSIVRMVIAMPYGHPVPVESTRFSDDYSDNNRSAMERRITDELLPSLLRDYNVATSASKRAIVGLSMGGGQSLSIGLRNLDSFAYVGGFSSATPDDDRGREFAELLGDAEDSNRRLKLLWIACGKNDFLFQRNNEFSRWLDGAGISHTYRVTDGGHSWLLWRKYLQEFLPLLFRAGGG